MHLSNTWHCRLSNTKKSWLDKVIFGLRQYWNVGEGSCLAPEAKQGRIYGYGYANPMRQGFPLHPTATAKAPPRTRVFAIAIYSAITVPLGRRSGRSSVSAAAYRAGIELFESAISHLHDYSHRGGVVKDASRIFFPDGELVDRAELWNGAEAAERRVDSRTAREWKLAIPHELPPLARSELAYEFAKHLVDRYGVAVDVAIHLPSRRGDDRNHHAHVLSTTRRVSRMEGGTLVFGNKTSIELADKDRKKAGIPGRAADEIKEMRALWSTLANEALARHGHDGCIDHRSYVDQAKSSGMPEELAFLPMIHLGPGATNLERKGTRTLPGNINRNIQRANLAIEQARKQWKQQSSVRPAAEVVPPFKSSAGAEIASTPTPSPLVPASAADTVARRDRLRRELQSLLQLDAPPTAAESASAIKRKREALSASVDKRIRENEEVRFRESWLRLTAANFQALREQHSALQRKGRTLLEQAEKLNRHTRAVGKWSDKHPMKARLVHWGVLKSDRLKTATSEEREAHLTDFRRSGNENDQLLQRLADARKKQRDAEQALEQVRAKVGSETRSGAGEASARLDQAELLVADLQRIEEAEQRARKLEALPIARNLDTDRDDGLHRRPTP